MTAVPTENGGRWGFGASYWRCSSSSLPSRFVPCPVMARAQLRNGAGCGVLCAVSLLRGLARALDYKFVPSSLDLQQEGK